MGWTYSYHKPANVKAELDRMLTWSNDDGDRRVLDSAIVNMKVYYAAVEHMKPGGEREVWAAVFLLDFRKGEFGYKDMTEHMGPYEHQCPERILNLLTPTDSENALQWRWDCRAYHARKADNKISEGAVVKFSAHWLDGQDTFRVAKAPRGMRGWRFYTLDGRGPYKLGGWRNRVVSVEGSGGAALAALGPRPTDARERFLKAHEADYIVGSAWGSWAEWVPDGKVGVIARRPKDGAEICALVDEAAYKARGPHGFIINPERDQVIPRPENVHASKRVA